MKLFTLFLVMACIYCALGVVILPKHVDSTNFWLFAAFMTIAITILIGAYAIERCKPDDYDRSTL